MKPDQALPRTAYTVVEVAASTGVSARHLRRLIDRGELHAIRLGGRVLIPASVFDQLIASAPSAAS